MAAVLPACVKRTEKSRFCRAKAFIHNKNAANRLTASWSALKNKKMKKVCVIWKSAVDFHFAAVEL